PLISAVVDSPTPPNAQGVYSNPVTVSFTGISDPAPQPSSSPGVTVGSYAASGINPATLPAAAGFPVTSQGTTTISWTVCDLASNCTKATKSVTLSLPVITGPQ